MSPEADDQPRSMRDADVRTQQSAMLGCPHMIDLTKFVDELREGRPAWEVSDFDPRDGGVEARALFLFEKPGPMTAAKGSGKRSGSGFISRDNDDPTAEAIFKFMRQAEIPREKVVLWNVIPWWNGTRAVKRAELEDGVSHVKSLIHLLPKLRAVMLVGKKAAKAKPGLGTTGLHLLESSHPSPIVKARWRERWEAIPSEWRKVADFVA
jgi:G:T/U-mismatch repair DNA glycosylase